LFYATISRRSGREPPGGDETWPTPARWRRPYGAPDDHNRGGRRRAGSRAAGVRTPGRQTRRGRAAPAGVVQRDLVVSPGSPVTSGRGLGLGTTTSHRTTRPISRFPLDYPRMAAGQEAARRTTPGHAATRRPAAPLGGAPGDDTGGLRVGWLQWIRRQLSADRGCLAGSHLTHPKRNHSPDHLPSVCDHRTSASRATQRVNQPTGSSTAASNCER
jgi:hypothetical protein